jgi:hypothetical protein
MTPTARLAIITIVATLGYLGLAILGWGGFAAFFSHPPLIALAIALFVLSGAALFSGGNLSPGEREDRANRWVIIAFAVIGLLSAYLPAYTDRKEFWTVDAYSSRTSRLIPGLAPRSGMGRTQRFNQVAPTSPPGDPRWSADVA